MAKPNKFYHDDDYHSKEDPLTDGIRDDFNMMRGTDPEAHLRFSDSDSIVFRRNSDAIYSGEEDLYIKINQPKNNERLS